MSPTRGTYRRGPVVVIGAGPYGLSTAAHLRAGGIEPRVFGEVMGVWRHHMPAGMLLESTPEASDIPAPFPGFTIADFERAHGGVEPSSTVPMALLRFVEYGTWYQHELVPTVDDRLVDRVDYDDASWQVTLCDGEAFEASAIVVATGLCYSARVPKELDPLLSRMEPLASHTFEHAPFSEFAGKHVAVIGSGQSALESAVLLAEAGATVELVARRPALLWGAPPGELSGQRQSRLLKPAAPLGPGWSTVLLSHGQLAIRALPASLRAGILNHTFIGAGKWWLRDRFDQMITVRLDAKVMRAEPREGRAHLVVRSPSGDETLDVDHVLAATGYEVDLSKTPLLSERTRRTLRSVGGSPRLGFDMQSSLPGLYFTGLPAAASFGPVLRFVYGARFAAKRVSASIARNYGAPGRFVRDLAGSAQPRRTS